MKKKFLVGLATVLFMFGVAGMASALTIDNHTGISGTSNAYWAGGAQSLTLDATQSHFYSIGFSFASQSWGRDFDFLLSDALHGGKNLFSTTFNVIAGINVIDINLNMTAGSTIYALVDYNGFTGRSIDITNENLYTGGNSFFYKVDTSNIVSFVETDHRFIAEFGPPETAPVPVPATILLFSTGLTGLIGTKLRRKKKAKQI